MEKKLLHIFWKHLVLFFFNSITDESKKMSEISGSGFFLVISLGYFYSNEGSGLL